MKLFHWHEINLIPNTGGVYAWYFTPEIAAADVDKFISHLKNEKDLEDASAARKYVEQFLRDNIFKYFIEQSYRAEVTGPLKPRYIGTLHHEAAISPTLIQRLIDNPERIKAVRKILASSVPNFSSPIYIGMSQDLSKRLMRHKTLIERYREMPTLALSIERMQDEEQRRDHSFAKETCSRGIPPSLLSVAIEPVIGSTDEWVDIENILNRIHFPLLGRN